VTLTAVAALTLLGGCANSPGEVPPTGVDELTVPTPAPDPGDFVDTVDNDWFPLERGTVQRWRMLGGPGGGVRVVVAAQPRVVAGVTATVVRSRATDDPEAGRDGWSTGLHSDFFAQDRDGNVWWLGRAGEWEAGVDGARAGLVVPADPRVGDGYRMALLEGVVEDRAEITAVDEEVVRLEVFSGEDATSGLDADATWEVFLERGVGPIRVEGDDEVLDRLTDPA